MSDTPTTTGFSAIIKHPQYFIPTGDTQFLAQNVLFKVHRYFFEREPSSFREIFSDSDGNTKPYTLDVKPEDFAHFLWVFYDEDFEYENQPLERWLVILRLATRWGFGKVRKLVVRQLERLDLQPIDKIKIYSDFKIDAQLLIPSYSTLAKSPTLPSLSEAAKLDIETILRLTMVRERALQKAAEDGCRSPTSASAGDEDVKRFICEIFGLPNTSTAKPPNTVAEGGSADGVDDTTESLVPTLQNPTPGGKKKKNANANGNSNAVSGCRMFKLLFTESAQNGQHTNGKTFPF
ncbi:uncharacterized protein F5891DRAFT_1018971 [Suillus fuscotomentosus]|uniref:BTB domain-containing protein n=1 Tax=Suillus fuscotomentosus TaxID=1912939 RepID=A0AAD4EEA8_9AGAM|nr:uncharacterized protein F5891DRAFT_1018971 [Suillus fuscotomentosus]KAG1903348.1 hypothetical protein F5891DRAFT_1018971 [Suillus fuscotomentosus]